MSIQSRVVVLPAVSDETGIYVILPADPITNLPIKVYADGSVPVAGEDYLIDASGLVLSAAGQLEGRRLSLPAEATDWQVTVVFWTDVVALVSSISDSVSMATSQCDPIRFVFGNAIRRGVLSVNTPMLSGQADYLANENRSRICRFPVNEPTVIECQLLNQRDIDAISLWQHNLSIHATVQFELLDSTGAVLAERLFEPPPSTGQLPVGTVWRVGVDPFDPPPPDAKSFPGTFVVWLDEPITADRLRVTLYDPKAVGGYSQLGMLFAGQSVRLTRGFGYGAPLKALTDGEVTRSASGYAIRSKLRRHARAWSVSLDDMPPGDRATIYAADEAYPNEPVLVSGYPAGKDWQQEQYNMLALLSQSPEYKHDYYQGHSTALNLLEV